MKLAIVGIFHETNTFAPGITEMNDFARESVQGNELFHKRYENTRTSMGGIIEAARFDQVELSCGIYTAATPSGMVSRDAADALFALLDSSIDTTADGVIAILHGAMVAEGFPDVEGEIIRRIREKIGYVKPVAITLDLHANISRLMVENVDILVGYDTYPHVDAYERGMEAVHLLTRTLRKEIKPVCSLAQPRLLIVPQVMLTDEAGPMQELMDRAFAIERDPQVLNVTVAGGFPYSDVPDAGVAFVVTTDNNQLLAEQYAEELSLMAWGLRERLKCQGYTAAEAVSMAFAEQYGPVILVEGSDNVGGGSPADATHVLKHLIGIPKKCLIVIRDPDAAYLAHQLGTGAEFHAEIGGKSDNLHGAPVPIDGVIRLLFDGKYTHIGSYMTGQLADMGKTAVIEAGNLTIIVTEKRTAPWDPGHVTFVGLRAIDFHAIVVKSAVAWKTAFGAICTKIIPVDTPGCCGENLLHLDYKLLARPIYPLDSISNKEDSQ
ncbi:M81 family peptidase [Paenibacillus psychroresistens]|uniref:M81 family peptidase n=1 Tax=Paenibacillus psychroresistens TaxID=1778678 RepID=A0A6B8RJQ6_9BACL|nr:M81 family metallopeptidase [Paenibacillus psychroresistens]QGQ95568.1 M81 family peptidase [Paenibacillus psychroresistens]